MINVEAHTVLLSDGKRTNDIDNDNTVAERRTLSERGRGGGGGRKGVREKFFSRNRYARRSGKIGNANGNPRHSYRTSLSEGNGS